MIGTSAWGGERFAPTYDLYLGGLWAAELQLEAAIGAESYTAHAVLRTKGMIGAVYGAAFDVSAEGQVTRRGPWRPERFVADTRSGSKAQWLELRYDGDKPISVRAEPAFPPKPWEVDPLAQRGAPDPLSAALAVMGPRGRDEVCNRQTEIFDGRRRIGIDLAAPVPDAAPADLVGPSQPRLRCGAIYRRIAGFRPKLMAKQREFAFAVWFQRQADGQYWVVRAEGETPLGEAVVRLRDQ